MWTDAIIHLSSHLCWLGYFRLFVEADSSVHACVVCACCHGVDVPWDAFIRFISMNLLFQSLH